MSNIDIGKPRLRALLGGLSTWSCGCCACQPLPRAISVLAMSKDNPAILPPPPPPPPPLSDNKNPLTMFVYKEIYNSFIYLSISTKYSRKYFHEVPLLSASVFLILVMVFSNKNHEVFIEIGNYVKNRGYI